MRFIKDILNIKQDVAYLVECEKKRQRKKLENNYIGKKCTYFKDGELVSFEVERVYKNDYNIWLTCSNQIGIDTYEHEIELNKCKIEP